MGVAQGVSGSGEMRTVDAGAGEDEGAVVRVWVAPTGQMVV
jgi:hypothetical protein